MVEGMDFVSGLIVQYALVEQLYTSEPSQLIVQLQKSLTELYVSILLSFLSLQVFRVQQDKKGFVRHQQKHEW